MNSVSKNYDEEFQILLISLMVSNNRVFTSVKCVLDPAFFNTGILSNTLRYILDYNKMYNTLPTFEEIEINTKIKLVRTSPLNDNNILAAINEIEQFCKKRKLELAVVHCAKLVSDNNAGNIDKIMKEALLFGIQKDLGLNFFNDAQTALLNLQSKQGIVPFGWDELDRMLGGGAYFGDLIIFCGGTGVGKSVSLQNYARNQALNGLNVVYLTHELKAELVLKRMSALFTDVKLSEINQNIDSISMQLMMKGKDEQIGNIQIKWLKPQSTILDIESYINEFETATGKIANIVISDYADLLAPTMHVNVENTHLREKYISEELRTFAQVRTENGKPTIVATASQLIKNGQASEELDVSNVSGSVGKSYTSDIMIGVLSTPLMQENNETRFILLKSRNSGGVSKPLIFRRDADTLLISNIEDNSQSAIYTKSMIEKLVKTDPQKTIERNDMLRKLSQR